MYYELELGGKKRGLKFNQISLEVFTKNINAEALESSAVYATFYAGLIGNTVAKREEQDYTFEDVVGFEMLVEIGDVLTPIGKQVVYVQATGIFKWGVAYTPNEYTLIQYF